MDASAATPSAARIVLSLTTSAARIPFLCSVLEHWNLTDVDRVLLHVPYVQRRSMTLYPTVLTPEILGLDPERHKSLLQKLLVTRCVDLGPATKYMGASAAALQGWGSIDDNTVVIVVDDDTHYHPKTWSDLAQSLEALEAHLAKSSVNKIGLKTNTDKPPVVVGGQGQRGAYWGLRMFDAFEHAKAPKIHLKTQQGTDSYTYALPVDICEGFGGVACRASVLKNPDFFSRVLCALDPTTSSRKTFIFPAFAFQKYFGGAKELKNGFKLEAWPGQDASDSKRLETLDVKSCFADSCLDIEDWAAKSLMSQAAWRSDDVLVNAAFAHMLEPVPRYVLDPRIPFRQVALPDALSDDSLVSTASGMVHDQGPKCRMAEAAYMKMEAVNKLLSAWHTKTSTFK